MTSGRPTDADVVIVGARVAGATLATRLARAGLRVRVLDKARLPSDTASTHIVQPCGVRVLDRLGVLEALTAARAGRFGSLLLAYDDARLEVPFPDVAGLSARRVVFDAVLLAAAAEAGAEIRTRTAVTGLLRDGGGRVCGVRTATGDVRAGLVVGADGRRSTVASLLGVRERRRYRQPRLAVWGYFAGTGGDAGRLRIGRVGEHAYVTCPADDGLLTVGFVPSMSEAATFLADRHANFARGITHWPELADIVAPARRVGPLRAVGDWHGYVRPAAGPGWALVGDAGTFKDPAAAQGMSDALRQADRLADLLLTDGTEAGCRRWARWRDRDCAGMHWFAADLGADGPTRPVTAQLVRDAAADPVMAGDWLAVLDRALPPGQLLTPRRLTRALAGAWQHDVGSRRAVLAEVGSALADRVRRAGVR